jgi:hypothetical protein
MKLYFTASAVLLLTSLLVAQSASFAQPSVAMAPVADVRLRPGATAKVELDFRVAQNFHINSNKPKSNLLIPTVLKLDAQQPLKLSALHYPAGEDQSFPFSPDEKLSVYSGDFALEALVSAPAKASAGTYTVSGELHYQACDKNACYPPKNLPVQFKVVVK